MSIKLIVGLRNPGTEYATTRHNAGGWFVEALANHDKLTFKLEKKLHGELAIFDMAMAACKLLLPTTYMNLSGQAVQAVCQFYRIHPTEIVVAHDELDLPVGRIKLKTDGGHGGHNGLRDIIQRLGPNFHRLRIGIGHPGHKTLVHDYVLSRPSTDDKQAIDAALERGIAIVPTLLTENIAAAMNILNR